jgi:hypothetical protein
MKAWEAGETRRNIAARWEMYEAWSRQRGKGVGGRGRVGDRGRVGRQRACREE